MPATIHPSRIRKPNRRPSACQAAVVPLSRNPGTPWRDAIASASGLTGAQVDDLMTARRGLTSRPQAVS
jgi:hypothetical protein